MKTDCRVRVTPSYAVECPCRHYEELMWLCRHAVPAVKAASTLVKLPQYQDVMDHLWLGKVCHLEKWRAQHTGVIKRVSLTGREEKLKQENLFPPRMHARPGRKRNKPYQPSQSVPRTCPACGMTGHFMANCPKPNAVELSPRRSDRKTIEAANELVIDLTNDSD